MGRRKTKKINRLREPEVDEAPKPLDLFGQRPPTDRAFGLLGGSPNPAANSGLDAIKRSMRAGNAPKTDRFAHIKPLESEHVATTDEKTVEIEFNKPALAALSKGLSDMDVFNNYIGCFMAEDGMLAPSVSERVRGDPDEVKAENDKLSTGGYDGVYMAVKGQLNPTNIRQLLELQDRVGDKQPVYLMSIDHNEKDTETADVEIMRFNPNLPAGIKEGVEAGLKKIDDADAELRKLQKQNSEFMISLFVRGATEKKEPFGKIMADHVELATGFLEKKIGGEQIKGVKSALVEQKDSLVKDLPKDPTDQQALKIETALLNGIYTVTTHLLAWKTFGTTNQLEKVAIENPSKNPHQVNIGLTEEKQALLDVQRWGMPSLLEGLKIESHEQLDAVAEIAIAGHKLREKTGVLKPLARACLESGQSVGDATLETIEAHQKPLVQLMKGKEVADVDAEMVSVALARGNIRSAVLGEFPGEGMNTQESIKEAAEYVAENLTKKDELPANLKDEFEKIEKAVKRETTHTLKEIEESEQLRMLHAMPVGAILFKGFNDIQSSSNEAQKQLHESLAETADRDKWQKDITKQMDVKAEVGEFLKQGKIVPGDSTLEVIQSL